jgi:hypothetical protein
VLLTDALQPCISLSCVDALSPTCVHCVLLLVVFVVLLLLLLLLLLL